MKETMKGSVKRIKAEAAGQEARRAAEEGHAVFVYNFNMSIWSEGGAKVSGPLPGAAERIEAIEAEGWHLEQTVARTADAFLFIFRRP